MSGEPRPRHEAMGWGGRLVVGGETWPSQDIAITNIV